MLTLFASKPTFARIVFLRSGWRLADKKALTMLKFILKSRQKTDELTRRYGVDGQLTRLMK